jgi:hypothetical protein
MSELLGIDEPVCVSDDTPEYAQDISEQQASMRLLLERVFNQVDDTLFLRADTATSNTHQNLHFESMRQLRLTSHKIVDAFMALIATIDLTNANASSLICAAFNRCAQMQGLPLQLLTLLSRTFHQCLPEYYASTSSQSAIDKQLASPHAQLLTVASPLQECLSALALAQHYQANQRRACDRFTTTDDALLQVNGAPLMNALGPRDQESVRLVRRTFAALMADSHIAPPAARWLMLLEVPVLRMALTDEAFFDTAAHPARQLMQCLTLACVGWEAPSERLVYDDFYRLLSDVVSDLIDEEHPTCVHFERAHGDIDAYLVSISKAVDAMGERALVMESLGQQLTLARRQASAFIQQLIDSHPVDATMRDFLRNLWADLLTMASFAATDNGWASLTSVTQVMVKQQTDANYLNDELIEQIRTITSAVASGQAAYVNKVSAFLERYRLSASNEAISTEWQSEDAIATELEVVAEPAGVSNDCMGESEAGVEHYFIEQVAGLSQGMWFKRMKGDGTEDRCRLVAIIRSMDKYIFTNRAGAKVAEESRISLAMALQTGRISVVDDYVLFDRTLESVIGGLRDLREQNTL